MMRTLPRLDWGGKDSSGGTATTSLRTVASQSSGMEQEQRFKLGRSCQILTDLLHGMNLGNAKEQLLARLVGKPKPSTCIGDTTSPGRHHYLGTMAFGPVSVLEMQSLLYGKGLQA